MRRCVLLLTCCFFSILITIGNAFAEEQIIHHGGVKMSDQNTFTCDYCESNQELWFAIRVKRSWGIPLIYPQNQTLVFCYDENTGMVSLEFQISEMIWELIADKTGIYYTKDHDLFLDKTICYYNKFTKKNHIVKLPSLVGNLIAVSDDDIFYQGSSAYNNHCVYKYNTNMETNEKIIDDIDRLYSDETCIYAIRKDRTHEITIYDLLSNSISTVYIPDEPIKDIRYGILLTDQLKLYQIGKTDVYFDLECIAREFEDESILIEPPKIYLKHKDSVSVYNYETPSAPSLSTTIEASNDYFITCSNRIVYIDTKDYVLHIINLNNLERTSFSLPL